ncbi:Synaptic vesicle transporter SV2 (major facilitator superfamily) [Handroanthus impetiginosus]|uniref:Synaptic vesicle transporter SV2 (Major facilitator superfamily) n=1 Tax=Handroanthus impetiginosus TaxID=429701 RepID=A0A2G9H598_9LAMI|nr:Synaptic vesicle transporter SV2 (major facilitator superfamily) [Handroanthus impetiginosus]
MEDVSHEGYTVDEALSSVGFGTFQGVALAFAGIGSFSDAMEVSLLSFIGPAIKSEWSISPTQESLLSTTVFAGMLIGAYFWGFMSDAYGRRMGIRGVGIIMYGAGFLSAFSPDYKSLVILRFFLGFGAAGGHIFSSWFLEFIPRSNRGSWMLVFPVFWIMGELLEASIAWIIMPRLGWRWLLAISSVPSLLVLLFSNIAPESPRYLFMKGRTNEAVGLLGKIAHINGKQLPTSNLVSNCPSLQLPEEENFSSQETPLLHSIENQTTTFREWLKSLCQLFSIGLLRTTILVWILSFVYTFSYYGLQLMISTLSSGQSGCPSLRIFSKNDSLYVNVFITGLAEIPGVVMSIVLVDRLGRKLCMVIPTMLAVIAILPLLFHQTGFVTIALLVSSRMFIEAAFSTYYVYIKEVYPTSVRASGVGLAISVGRIGGMVCPLVAVGLVRGCHQTLAVIMFGIIILLSGISASFFPFETKGRGLNDIVSDIIT